MSSAKEQGGAWKAAYWTRRSALLASVAALGAPSRAWSQAESYKDPSLPTSQRIADLLSRMTIEEKVAQLCCMWGRKAELYDDNADFSVERAREVIGNGIGQMARPSDIRGRQEWNLRPFRTIESTVKFVNDVQRFLVEETRLGIPALFHEELAHGLLAGKATIFPSPPALASTWDEALIESVFSVAAKEARVRGAHIALTPVVDLARDPRYGRVEEFFSEDPYLAARIGVAAVRGMQGRSRPIGPDRVFCTLKHFVHGTPLGGRNISPADVGERTLRDTYLVPFQEIVEAVDPAIIMPSYNEVQGVPAHANAALLQQTGRGQIGFHGAYLSDYEGIENLRAVHRIAATNEDAAVLAINAGVAADLPEGTCYRSLADLVRSGRVQEAQLDEAAAQILALKFEAGLFENPYVSVRHAVAETDTGASRRLARRVAEKAQVLLKNDGILPLRPEAGFRLAVIGPNAKEPLFGGYSGDNDAAVGILDGVRARAPGGVSVEHADGVWIAPPDAMGRHRSYSPLLDIPVEENRARIEEAVALARRSDVVLLVLGDVPAITREAVALELPGDRSSLGLWGQQDELVDAIAATGKPIVGLLLNGRALAIEALAAKANALIEGWYLGQEGGAAFARVLFGDVNPGGKLTVSFPRSVGQLPVYYNRHPSADVNTYLDSPTTPLFPFGHGLSYTTFEVSAPRLEQSEIDVGTPARFEVDVANTGQREGDEVVQIYLRDNVSSVPRPVLELKAFARVSLRPGERQTLRFSLPPDALAIWDINMHWVVEPGVFTVYAGNSSSNLKAATLTVRGVQRDER